MRFCCFQPVPNQVHVGLGGFAAVRGFFLKAMQHINGIAKFHGVDRPVGVAFKILDNFQYARAAKTSERFGLLVFSALLSQVKGVTKTSCTSLGNAIKSFFDEATQSSGLLGSDMKLLYPNGNNRQGEHQHRNTNCA